MILRRASDPRLSERLGTTRREAIQTAIGIWARGSLRNQGKLVVLPAAGAKRKGRKKSAAHPPKRAH
jgi:hypothetical protein